MKIVEASIAIVIIISVLFILHNREGEDFQVDYSERARDILEEASRNSTIRQDILNDDDSSLSNLVGRRIPENFLNWEIRVCDVDDVCGISTFIEGNVYSGERVISSTLTSGPNGAKKARIFIWEIN